MDQHRSDLDRDLQFSMRWLLVADSPDDVRRGMRLSLSTLYTWRELERKHLGLSPGLRSIDGARVLEDLIELRGTLEHEVVKSPRLQVQPLTTSDLLVPSENTVPGDQPYFQDEPNEEWGDKKKAAFESLRGRPVVPALGDAGDFLRTIA